MLEQVLGRRYQQAGWVQSRQPMSHVYFVRSYSSGTTVLLKGMRCSKALSPCVCVCVWYNAPHRMLLCCAPGMDEASP